MISFDRIDGLYSDFQRRIASVIRDIFPTVRLLKLEPGHPSFTPERPYALVDEPHLLPPYVIKTLRESEIDERLIAFLVENNMGDPNSKANRLALLERAQAAVRAKAEIEWMEERRDIMKSMLKSKKNEYRHNGKVLKK